MYVQVGYYLYLVYWVDRGREMSELSASEALYGFCGWLTSKEEITVMGSSEDASVVVGLIADFCKENNLAEPREGWHLVLIHPSGEVSTIPE